MIKHVAEVLIFWFFNFLVKRKKFNESEFVRYLDTYHDAIFLAVL